MPSIYAGTNKIKSVYVGTTKIRKIYVGSTLVFGGAPVKKTNATSLSYAKYEHAGASNANYAIFAGGDANTGGNASTDAYNANLVRTVAPILPINYSQDIAGTMVGSYALVGGGGYANSDVSAYNLSLVRSSTTLQQSRSDHAGATLPSYGVYAGGCKASGTKIDTLESFEVFNSSLTRTFISGFSSAFARRKMAGGSVGNYALFAGGRYYDSDDGWTQHLHVDYLNNSLVKGYINLSFIAQDIAGASTGDYAIFAGGGSYAGNVASANAFNSSLVRTILTDLSVAREVPCGIALGGYALIAGGYNSKVVDMYDSSLVRTTMTSLTEDRYSLASATVGDYALFAGGYNVLNGYRLSSVEVYGLG